MIRYFKIISTKMRSSVLSRLIKKQNYKFANRSQQAQKEAKMCIFQTEC